MNMFKNKVDTYLRIGGFLMPRAQSYSYVKTVFTHINYDY